MLAGAGELALVFLISGRPLLSALPVGALLDGLAGEVLGLREVIMAAAAGQIITALGFGSFRRLLNHDDMPRWEG